MTWYNSTRTTFPVFSVLSVQSVYLPTFLDAKAWDFYQDLSNHFTHIQKCSENLPQIYEDNPNVSEDVPKIFGSRSQEILCQVHQSHKSKNIPQNNCHLRALFNLLLVWVQITRLHIAYFPNICQPSSDMAAATHIFQRGMRNWSVGVSEHEIKVFNPQAWDSRPRRESWQV